MKKQKFQKGAISVFLVIILIPCMVISSVFVDMSRVLLAKGSSSSAADLALNSLMANYDPDLSEYYGLVASCQDIDQFYEESARFFLEALYSQGLNAEDAESLLAYVNASLVGSDVHDLLQVEVQTETKDIVTPVKNASLGESAVIIKDGIVEFMKYRAPIEITSKIVERLKNSGAASTLQNASKDEALVEDKQDYAEAEEDFMDAAYKTYKAVKAYESLRKSYGLNQSKMQTMMSDMKKARETYREVIQLMVSNLNGTSELTQFKRPVRSLNAFSYTAKQVSSSSKKKDGKTTYYINQKKIDKLLTELDENITKFKDARKAVSDKVTDKYINASIGAQDNQYNPIQWWKKVDDLLTSGGRNSVLSKYETAADNMLKSYAKVLAIKKCTLDKNVTSDWESKYNSLTQSVKDLQKDFLTAGVGEKNNNKYLKLVNKLEKYSKDYKNKIKDTQVKLKDGRTVKQAISDVNNTLSTYSDLLQECIDELDTIINGGGGIAKNNPYKLDTLSKKAKEYNKAYTTWKGTAEKTDTSLGEKDREEIQTAEANGGRLAASPDDINKFKQRAVNVKNKLQSVKDTIDGMKLGTKKLIDIDSSDTVYKAIKNDIGENLTNSAIKSKAAQIFKNKFTPYSSSTTAEVANIDFSSKDASPLFKENEPTFHKWMTDQFGGTTEEKVKKAKTTKKKKDEEAKTKEEEAKEKPRSGDISTTNLYKNESYKGEEFPSGLDGNLPFSALKGIAGSFTTTVTCLAEGNIDGIRDALYATEYVMDMFSYSTYVYEGKYRLGMETQGWTAAEAEAAYPYNNNKVTGSADKEKTWLSEKPTDRYNKTLTNHMINSENNVLHGAEVEYVLYGKKNKANVTSVYGNIFIIRYALNTVSGFQHFWGSDTETGFLINSAATTLSSATGGVVPAAVIKCISILLLTAIETGSDLDRLSKGFQVEIYKTSDTQWACSFSATVDEENTTFSAGSGGSGTSCSNGLFYSDYLYLFVLMGFQSSSASEMYRRTADLIQVNMRKYTKDNGYMLKNAKSYFQINATIRVDPLMLALPIAQVYDKNPSDRSDWCTFTITEKRGYS